MSKRVRFNSTSSSKTKVAPKATTKDPKRKGERRVRKKPQWDTTVSDLTVHRLSKAELERRHVNAKSKNVETARHELYEKAKGGVGLDSSGNQRPSPKPVGSAPTAAAVARKALGLQRALPGKGLHQVLAESDRALAAVKDIFGDDPKRYVGRPNVTVAPHITNDKKSLERTILESQQEGPWPTAVASPGGIRDESILELAPKKPALNDLPLPELNLEDSESLLDNHTPSVHGQPQTSYRPTLDLRRFRQLLQNEESKSTSSAKNTETGHRPLHLADISIQSRPTDARNDTRASAALFDQGMQTGTKTLSEKHPWEGRERQGGQDLDESLTGISELSSIPGAGNLADTQSQTINSEASTLIAPPLQPQRPHPQPPIQVSVNKSTGERSGGDMHAQQTQPSVQQHHPLHVTNSMPSQRQPLEGEGPESHTGGTETERGGEGESGTKTRVRKISPTKMRLANSRSPHQEHARVVQDDLQVLEKLVQGLEAQLQEYEQEMGCSISFETPTLSHPGTFSGITASLLASVTKLTHYLKQSEAQLRGEVEVRGQLLHTMTEQQNLMDAMTTDMVKLQEENISLRAEMRETKRTNDERIVKLQDDLAAVNQKLSSLALTPSVPRPFPPPSTILYPMGPQAPSHAYSPLAPMTVGSLPWDSPSLHLPSVADQLPVSATVEGVTSDTNKEAKMSGLIRSHSGLTKSPTVSVPPPQTLPAPPSTLPHSVIACLSSPAPQSSGVIYAQVSPLAYPEYGSSFSPAVASAATTSTHHTLPLPPKHVHFAPTRKTVEFIHIPSVCSSNYHAPQAMPHVTMNPSLAVTSPSQYAPSPPPLSVALQVPTLSTTTGLSSLRNTTPQTFPYYHLDGTRHGISFADPVDLTRPHFDTSWLLKDDSREYKFTPTDTSHLPRQQTQQSTPSGLTAPDLSILSSLTETQSDAAASKNARESSRGSDVSSPNFLDMRASAEKISTLARSVLQELAQQNPVTTGAYTTSATTTSVGSSESAPIMATGAPKSLDSLPANGLHYYTPGGVGTHYLVSTAPQPVMTTKDSGLVLPTTSALQPSSHLRMYQLPSGTTTAVAQESRGVPPSSKVGWFALSSHVSH